MRSSPVVPSEFLDAAADLVRRRTGLVFGETRRSAFDAALVGAIGRAAAAEPGVYLARLDAEPALLDDLVAEITIGETYFFREPQQFRVIRDEIIPTLRPQGPSRNRRHRIWSAGCATGEEPYTVAIVLRELGLENAAHIVATDLSRTALARARRALYTRWALRGVPAPVVQTYFEPVGDRFALVPAVRDAVEFRYLNLAEDIYPSLSTGIWGMDLILCRNVLIYFGAETVVRVARGLIDSLSDGGWLLLGASDPPLADLVPCDVVVTEAGLAYRRAGRGSGRPGRAAAVALDFTPPPWVPPAPEPPSRSPFPAGGSTPASLIPEEREPNDVAEATRCYAERDYERAAELAARLVQRDGSDPAPWVVLVRALANRGELEAAGRASVAALDRQRTSAELNYLHALLLAEAGRHADAAAAARRALYLDRELVVAHLALGGVLAQLGDTKAADRSFRNAERLLVTMPPGDVVPASDGEPAGRLVQMARLQLQLLNQAAA